MFIFLNANHSLPFVYKVVNCREKHTWVLLGVSAPLLHTSSGPKRPELVSLMGSLEEK